MSTWPPVLIPVNGTSSTTGEVEAVGIESESESEMVLVEAEAEVEVEVEVAGRKERARRLRRSESRLPISPMSYLCWSDGAD